MWPKLIGTAGGWYVLEGKLLFENEQVYLPLSFSFKCRAISCDRINSSSILTYNSTWSGNKSLAESGTKNRGLEMK